MTLPRLILHLCGLPLALAAADAPNPRSCRILFLEAPADAPQKLVLFDGKDSREVELPHLNLSPVYNLPGGPLKIHLLDKPPADPRHVPTGAPAAVVPESSTDIYLLVSADPGNKVAPVRMQVINAGSEKLKRGEMLWFNLTDNTVGGVLGDSRISLEPRGRAVMEAPARGNKDYPVKLGFRMPDNPQAFPLCQTSWRHNPQCRSLAFVIPKPGTRSPRVLVFSDYRNPRAEEDNP